MVFINEVQHNSVLTKRLMIHEFFSLFVNQVQEQRGKMVPFFLHCYLLFIVCNYKLPSVFQDFFVFKPNVRRRQTFFNAATLTK